LGLPSDLSWRLNGFQAPAIVPDVVDLAPRESDQYPLHGFASAYHDYFPRVFAYVYGKVRDKDKAVDIVSDTFEQFFIKGYFYDSPNAPAWRAALFRVARARIECAFASGEVRLADQAPPDPFITDVEDFARAARLSLVQDALSRLPLALQDIIALKFDAELTNEEIALILASSEARVRVQIFRSLRILRQELGSPRLSEGDDDEGSAGALVPAG